MDKPEPYLELTEEIYRVLKRMGDHVRDLHGSLDRLEYIIKKMEKRIDK